ncbi:hypothetical protein [Clostridium tagluense]|uniref:Uncharacterized protein n=1 Tax=Clostridium tagluense TaxID=360422 RepID=A0A401USU1_9CLOT|nr:hypothetical protein [Clostridium tagluense]GCD12607.1 hypothetical protein Ctaglu_42300 [Clostridium tagluense]
MTNTNYFSVNTGQQISEAQVLTLMGQNRSSEFESVTECLECGKIIEAYESCDCEY